MKHRYYLKLSGVSFRQDVVKQLVVGETQLKAVARPENEYDPLAVEIQAYLNDEWTQVGWIPKGQNADISAELLNGHKVEIILTNVTGSDDQTHGVNVGVIYGKDDSAELNRLPYQKVVYGDEKSIFWDEVNHKAYSLYGDELVSGSAVEHAFSPDVDLSYAARAIAKSTGTKKEDVIQCWDIKRDLAANFGTLIHLAMENYFMMMAVTKKIDENKEREHTAKTWIPHLLGDIVDGFLSKTGWALPDSTLVTEARIKSGGATGITDLMSISGEDFILNDYKITKEIKEVNYDVFGKYPKYTLQQNFYREIMESLGFKCKGMFLWQFDGKNWTQHKVPKLNIKDEVQRRMKIEY